MRDSRETPRRSSDDVEVRYDQEHEGGFLTVVGIGFGVVFLAEFHRTATGPCGIRR
jgi:hypothetical protein